MKGNFCEIQVHVMKYRSHKMSSHTTLIDSILKGSLQDLEKPLVLIYFASKNQYCCKAILQS